MSVSKKCRIVLATGGTGGHIFPALAVAREIENFAQKQAQVIFVGGKYGQEKKLILGAGYNVYLLPVKGILGKGVRSITNMGLVLYSSIICYLWLKKIRPSVIAGFGSYASFVPVYVGYKMGIPTCIHEQNSYPGFTNRFLGKRVDKVFLSFPDEAGIFEKHKTEVLGNPVRQEIIDAAKRENGNIDGGRKKINLLIVGGSQGAKGINDAVMDSLVLFKTMGVSLYHQTGELDYERVLSAYKAAGIDKYKVVPFIEDMKEAYLWADLVVCRAGASTIFELATMGKPSILIPYPYAANDHQRINARFLERVGGAMVVEQPFLESNSLGSIVADLVAIPGKLKEMSKAARSIARPDASLKLTQRIVELGRC
ncbi:undecaprenyldiphospho-muramoylpentapeptide beta-N-acetylglucosaminyltransferase [Desulfothermus okinawensis JCM 13304]